MALIRFSSRAAGELFMLDQHAELLFRLIGKDAGAQGVVTTAQIPAALTALRAAVAHDKTSPATGASANDEAADASAAESGGVGVKLAQRAWPLIDMLERAEKAGADVLWGV